MLLQSNVIIVIECYCNQILFYFNRSVIVGVKNLAVFQLAARIHFQQSLYRNHSPK